MGNLFSAPATQVADPVAAERGVVAPALLHTALRDDYGECIINFLTHVDAGRLEWCLSRDSVFGTTPLLGIVVGRLNNAAEAMGTAGATYLNLDREVGGDCCVRVTWSREIGLIRLAVAQYAAAAGKKMISAGANHSLVVSSAGVWSFGHGANGQLGHGGTGCEQVPRIIEALACVIVTQVGAGENHSMALVEYLSKCCRPATKP